MDCISCGVEFSEKKGTLSFSDRIIGEYSVSNVLYYHCSECSEYLFPPETIDKLEKTRAKRTKELIDQLSIRKFVSASEAAELLGISRQAFHKHRHIKRGFIFSTTINEKKYFVRRSVLLFKENGDGRYPLVPSSWKMGLIKTFGRTIPIYTTESDNWIRKSELYTTPHTGKPLILREGSYGKKYSR